MKSGMMIAAVLGLMMSLAVQAAPKESYLRPEKGAGAVE